MNYLRLSYVCKKRSGEAIVKVVCMNDVMAEKEIAISMLARRLNVEVEEITVVSAWSLGDNVLFII